MTASTIARLKITLEHVTPAVQRRVEVPVTIRLDRLHLVFQAALGWTNSHLYEIRARDVGWGLADPDWGDGPLDAAKSRLIDLIKDTGAKTLKYIYDFGDGWEHTVKIECIVDAVPGLAYPILIDATGRCPPEDVGGPPGYSDLLEILADPGHERYTEITEWIGGTFDPRAMKIEDLAKAVDALARKWTRKTVVKKKSAN
jgi:Plasmid pRiA4b ORF-3-like protein